MFNKKVNKEEIDKGKINEVVSLSKRVLQILYIILVIVGIYALIRIAKELTIFPIIKKTLKIMSPLFLGFVFAWLLDPIVTWFKKKGIRRSIGALIVYLVLISILLFIISSIIPVLSEQINDFVSIIPDVFAKVKTWINGFFNNLSRIENLDVESMKVNMFVRVEEFSTNLTKSLPTLLVNFVTSFLSGFGIFVVGLIIGFFFLVSFDNVNDTILPLIPEKFRNDTKKLLETINVSLRNFVKGAFFDSTLIFVISSICFIIFGLRAPLLFGLFCGLTNVIPYAGPYIGGIPAVIVGFSQGTTIGVLTLVSIVVIQFLEGNFLQPIIMSKTTKLHPVTIIIGLLVFGYFFNIIGMLVATPIIAMIKAILVFFNEKYEFLKF